MAEMNKIQGPLHFIDDNTYITKDVSNNLSFTDIIVGTKTLFELVNGPYLNNYATLTTAGWDAVTDKTVLASTSVDGPLGSTTVIGLSMAHGALYTAQLGGRYLTGAGVNGTGSHLFIRYQENSIWHNWEEVYHTGFNPWLLQNQDLTAYVGFGTNGLTSNFEILNPDTYLTRDGSGNLSFTDGITGTKTLAELLGGSSNRIENTATTSYLEFGTLGADAFATLRTSSTTISDKLLVFENGTPAEIRYFDVGGNYIDASYNLLAYYGSGNLFLGHAGVIGKTDYTGAINNIGIGPSALDALNTGDTNTAIGSHALGALTIGNYNIAIGPSAGISIIDEIYTINIGYQTDVIGLDAIGIGRRVKGSGDFSIGIGGYAHYKATGTGNVSMGYGAKREGILGDYNVTIGHTANYYGTGSYNVLLGYRVAYDLTFTGSRNVLLGSSAGYHLGAGSDDNIFIGSNSGFWETGSDVFLLTTQTKTDIGTHRAAALMYGVMGAITADQILQVNAKLQIFAADTYINNDGSNITFTDPTTGTKTLADLTADLWTLSGSNIYFNTGLVGVGTSNPGVSLDVETTDAAGIRLYRNGINSSIQIQNSVDSVYFGVNNLSMAVIGFSADQTNAPFKINTSGNIGIGANPSGNIRLYVYDADYTTSGDITLAQFRRQYDVGGNSAGLVIRNDGGGSIGITKLLSTGSSAQNMGLGPTGLELYIQKTTGNVGIGTTSPNANAILDLTSTTKAFLPPRMTLTQTQAISSPVAGMVVYVTDENALGFYNGSAWVKVTTEVW